MSGLEAAAFILNASDVSCKVIAAAIDYGQKVKAARQQMESLRCEMREVSKLLDDLHTRATKAKEDDGTLEQWPSLKNIDEKDSPMSRMRLELCAVLDLLGSQKMSTVEHLLWPRKMKKIEKSMQQISKQRDVLIERMKIDTG